MIEKNGGAGRCSVAKAKLLSAWGSACATLMTSPNSGENSCLSRFLR